MSRRNNSDRLGAPHPDAPTPTPVLDTDSGIFSFVRPTEFVILPTEGRYYPEDHPLHNCKTIEIKHMTAKEEDILTSEALQKTGLAINRLVQSIIIDKTINPDTLYLGDKNALIIAARITGYGPHYDVATHCPSCARSNEQTFNLEDIKNDSLDLPDGVEDLGGGLFRFDLPQARVPITVRLLNSADETRLAKLLETKQKNNKEFSPITDLLKSVIVSVADVTDLKMVHEFVELMPLPDVRVLRTTYEALKPDVNLTFEYACSFCSHEGEVTMPLTAQFFWPNT